MMSTAYHYVMVYYDVSQYQNDNDEQSCGEYH